MKIIKIYFEDLLLKKKKIIDNLVVTFGYFDSLHKGHMSLINKCKYYSNKYGYKSAVLTFDRNKIFLKKGKQITEEREKKYILKNNIDYLLTLEMNKNLLNLNAKDFIKYITEILNLKILIVGENFYFGHNRQGNLLMLEEFSHIFNFLFIKKKLLKLDNKIISTTYIKQLLQQGNIFLANQLLGYKYSINGIIIKGKSKGREIGFPTANVLFNKNKLLPSNGVYATKVIINKKEYFSISNIGYAPTIKKLQKTLLEVHIFKFNDNIYNSKIEIKFYEKIRDEIKFDNLSLLINQINNDIKEVKKIFKIG